MVEVGHRLRTRVLRERRDWLAWRRDLGDPVGARAAEDHEVEERVGAEAVGAVHAGAGDLAAREEALHHIVVVDRAIS